MDLEEEEEVVLKVFVWYCVVVFSVCWLVVESSWSA